jgi:ABC-type amino acid transport substrate-binding protein
MLLSLSACKSGKDDNILVMATNAEFPPYEYFESEAIVGIDVEIAEALAEKLGMELKIETWNSVPYSRPFKPVRRTSVLPE